MLRNIMNNVERGDTLIVVKSISNNLREKHKKHMEGAGVCEVKPDVIELAGQKVTVVTNGFDTCDEIGIEDSDGNRYGDVPAFALRTLRKTDN